MKALLAIPALLLLAGCAVPVAEGGPTIGTRIPAATQTCAPEPSGAKVKGDKAIADYVARLADAGRDCRRNLAAVHDILGGT